MAAILKKFKISFSRAYTYRSCQKQYEFKYLRKLTKKAPALPLVRGKILGEMLNERAAKKPYQPVIEKYQKKYGALFEEEKQIYGDILGDCQRIIEGYDRLYSNEEFKYVGTEVELNVALSPSVEFVGYIDKLVADSKDRIWVMDHKSHAVIPSEEQRFSDLQLVFYGWARDQLVSAKKKTFGVVWDYLRTKPPTIPDQLKSGELTQRKDIDTDLHTYSSEIRRLGLSPENYTEILTALSTKPNNFFRRVQLPTPPTTMIQTLVDDLLETANEIKSKKSRYVRNMTRNCAFCEFYQLCHAELRGLDWEFIQKSQFTEREPNDGKPKKD